MAVTFLPLPQQMILLPTETTRVLFHKIVFLSVTLTSILHMYSLEGSVSDSHVFGDACSCGNLEIPKGQYLLGDLGFPSKASLLVPYQGVCYHLAEWGRADVW